MKIAVIFLVAFFTFALPDAVLARNPIEPLSNQTSVSAQIGDLYLDVSGIISPYASLSLLSDGNMYKSAVADSYGRFSFSNVLVKRGFSGFCITASDRSNLGKSEACFSFSPATQSIKMNDVFLPPTLALKENEVTEGNIAFLSGYTMPGAEVEIIIGGERSLYVVAESDGQYKYELSGVKRGSYDLVTRATYLGQQSSLSSYIIHMRILPLSNAVAGIFKDTAGYLSEFAPLLGLIFLGMLVVCVIKWDSIVKLVRSRRGRLHHAWFIGY